MWFKKKREEIVSIPLYLKYLGLTPSKDVFEFTKKWVDKQILPMISKGHTEYLLKVPLMSELVEDTCKGEYLLKQPEYYTDYLYFWYGLEDVVPSEVVALIVQVLLYYNYKVSWKISKQNVIFNIGLF